MPTNYGYKFVETVQLHHRYLTLVFMPMSAITDNFWNFIEASPRRLYYHKVSVPAGCEV